MWPPPSISSPAGGWLVDERSDDGPTSTRRGGFAPYGRHGRRQRRII
jgi:hypothetical protein